MRFHVCFLYGVVIDAITIASVFYEYIITVDDEVRTVWRRNFNITSLLLLTVRWAMVMSAVVVLLPTSASVSPSVSICPIELHGLTQSFLT